MRLMKTCPKVAVVKKSEVSDSENDGEKGKKGDHSAHEIVFGVK